MKTAPTLFENTFSFENLPGDISALVHWHASIAGGVWRCLGGSLTYQRTPPL